jgi:putative ABC transport system permease protein
MRTVLLASLRHHRRRYVASALAVVIGVAFIVATNGLAGALRSGMTADVGEPYERASHVVTPQDADQAAQILTAAEDHGVAASAVWTGWLGVRSQGQAPADLFVGSVADDPALQWQSVVEGRMPARDGEALLAERTALDLGHEVGDTLTLGAGPTAVEVEVVGLADDPVLGGQDLYLRGADAERTDVLWPEIVLFDGDPGLLPASVADAPVVTSLEYASELQAQITREVDVIAMLVSIFAAVALGVAVLVITNTFAILFTQRMRDFALLRCVGVTRRQLRRSVRLEALVLGVVSSLVGVVIGVVVSYALAALVGIWFDGMGVAGFTAPWIVAAVLVGVAVTVAAAWLPTRSVTRISPLAAMRPAGSVDVRTRAGALRTVSGLLVAGTGVGLLAYVVVATGADEPPDSTYLLLGMLAGGFIAFVGVLLLGPLLVPQLLRVLGRVASPRGPAGAVGRLATGNSVRNPRRSATTTASLMVGVTLTTAVLVGLSSVRQTLSDEFERSYPLDVTVQAAELGASLSEDLVAAVAAAEGVDAAVPVEGATVRVAGQDLLAVGVSGSEEVLRAAEDAFGGAEVLMPYDLYVSLPERAFGEADGTMTLRVRTAAGPRELTLAIGDQYGVSAVAVRTDVLTTVAPATQPVAVWARAEDGASPSDLLTDLTRVGAEQGVALQIGGDLSTRVYIDTQFVVVTAAVVGLLGVAVVIALIGIANTLGLSVLERTRENSLLRAMGITRRQLRRTLALEGLLLAVVATVLGVAIGAAFGWVGVEVLVGALGVDTTFAVPWLQLALVVAVAAVAGVLASVVPSRRAARVSPAAGLALE